MYLDDVSHRSSYSRTMTRLRGKFLFAGACNSLTSRCQDNYRDSNPRIQQSADDSRSRGWRGRSVGNNKFDLKTYISIIDSQNSFFGCVIASLFCLSTAYFVPEVFSGKIIILYQHTLFSLY